jgi:hypothetical protein
VLQGPEPIPRLLHLPRGADALARLLPRGLPGVPGMLGADEITGCVLSGLLSLRFAELPPTIGEVAPDAALQHYRRLRTLGFRGARLHCEGSPVPPETVARFRAQAAASVAAAR